MRKLKIILPLLFGLMVIATACQPPAQTAEPSQTLPPTLTAGQVTPTLKPVTIRISTETSIPATPTLTPTTSLTPTPTPHPMSIEALRDGVYPGSDIQIENELAPGTGYHRYYASYLSEGLKIYALLTIPDGTAPTGGWPAIIFNHGFIPPQQYRTTEGYIAYVDDLARAGFIVFRIDYRGNGSSEGLAKGAYGDPGYTIDVLNAIASIKRHPRVNPQKIGIWGHSMGGFLTLRAMVISKDIKAGVIWSGVVASYPDLINLWHPHGATQTPIPGTRGWRSGWLVDFGAPDKNPAFWNSISANSYLADLFAPLQLHHDTADSEVPYAFSETLAGQLKDAGKTVEFFSYPGDDHNLANSFNLAMTRTIQFYDKYLK